MKDFILNLLNGFFTSVITFIIITFVPLPNLFYNLEKIIIFAIIASIIGYTFLRERPLSHLTGTVIGGVLAGFVIFNYGLNFADYATNSFIGAILVGVLGTVTKFIGV
jgi:hypothetical protein